MSFKVLVISDLHCTYKPNGEEVETRLYSNLLRKPSNKHPIEALKIVAKEHGVKVDMVICPGDITDKSDDQGFLSGFGFLQEVTRAVKADDLICTLGNHDVDTHGLHSKKHDNIPKNVGNGFPLFDENLNKDFWAKHFALKMTTNSAILVFNSVYTHTKKENSRQSMIDDGVLAEMEEVLANIPKEVRYRIGVCHHHPMKHANTTYPDDDAMDKGDALLELLSKYDFQFFIHGHKHEPRLNYWNSLPVLASGSFASFWNTKDLGAENTFHLIELEDSGSGKIITYVYGPSKGWHLKHDAYFPCHTGFGYQGDIVSLSNKIKEWFDKKDTQLCLYSEVLKEFPQLNYLIPQDQAKINGEIKKLGLSLLPELPNLPEQILTIKN